MVKKGYKQTEEHRKKLSLALMGNTRSLGYKHSEESRKKMGLVHKEKKFTEEHKQKLALAKLGELNPSKREDVRLKLSKPKSEEHKKNLKKSWENEERRNKSVMNILQKREIYPAEQRLLSIIEKNNLPFNYVGNGQLILNGFCPDFLSKNPKHIIELFGGYHRFSGRKERDEKKIKVYSSLGYKTLIVWHHELLNEEKLVHKIKEFTK